MFAPDYTPRLARILVALSTILALSASPVTAQTSVWSWGWGFNGELGTGATQSSVPVEVSSLTGLSDVVALSAAPFGYHTLAVKADGAVWAWGRNLEGQLGDGTTSNRVRPVKVTGVTGVTMVSAGVLHSLALRADGTVWAWGSNDSAQLGDGTTIRRLVPVQVAGLTGVVAVGAGASHSLALKADGTVWAWGVNGTGELGDGTLISRLVPVQVTGLTSVVAVSAGASHSLALKADGTAWAWGGGSSGQRGDGTKTLRQSLPVPVSGLVGAAAISAGYETSLAVRTDGTVWAWGDNYYGQLGDGTTTDRWTPVQVMGLTGVTAISAGAWHSLAVKGDGTAWGWGQNVVGQLGDGTTTEHWTPVQVSGLPRVSVVSAGRVDSFSVQAPYLVFRTQPAAGASGTPLATQPVVEVRSPDGSLETAFTGLVTVAIKPGTGAGGAVLGGTTSVNAVAGVAAFTDISLNVRGEDYVLIARSGPLKAAESQPFDVTMHHGTLTIVHLEQNPISVGGSLDVYVAGINDGMVTWPEWRVLLYDLSWLPGIGISSRWQGVSVETGDRVSDHVVLSPADLPSVAGSYSFDACLQYYVGGDVWQMAAGSPWHIAFTMTPPEPPTITSFAPTSGGAGTSVTITGKDLAGTTAVTFNGVATASFHQLSATSVTAVVPTSSTTGLISVTTPGGTATSATPFTVIFAMADVRETLRWVAGVSTLPPSYLARYDVVANGSVDLLDAVRIARMAAGLEANP